MSKTETDKFGVTDQDDLRDFMTEVERPGSHAVTPEAALPDVAEGFVRLADFIKRKKKPTVHKSRRAIAIARYRAQRDLYPSLVVLDQQESGPVTDGAEVLEDSIKG